MYVNTYVLEVMMRSRLAELRAEAARYRALAELRSARPGFWAALRALLHRNGARESGRKIASPRPA